MSKGAVGPREPGSAHLGEILTALLDGELGQAEAAAATGHVSACAACGNELEGLSATRSLVRALPLLDPPAGLVEGLLGAPPAPSVVPAPLGTTIPLLVPSGGRRARLAVWMAGAAAAGALVMLSTGSRAEAPVQPPVASFVDAHATAAVAGDPISSLAPVAVPASFGP